MILAHRCARTRRRCKCIQGVHAWRERAHLDVLWRHSRKHTELAAEHMMVRTSLAKLCKRYLLRTGIPYALSGASNVEQRLDQELQLHQFLLTQRVTHKVLRTYFPLESKQARAQRNLSSQNLDRETEKLDHPSITVRHTKWWKSLMMIQAGLCCKC